MGIKRTDANGNVVESYVGKVIMTREQNLAHDSYFYAYVWDAGKVVKVETGATAYAGSDVVKVDLDSHNRFDLETHMLASVVDYITNNPITLDLEIKVGTRVKSLTSKGKAFGVVGKVVGLGTGQYGDFFKVKDENTGRVVIVSTNKVASMDTGEITDDMWSYAIAVTLGDRKAFRKSGDVRWLVTGFAQYGLKDTIDEITGTLEDILSDIGPGKVYASWDDYMGDVASTDDMGWIEIFEENVIL